MNKNRLSKTLAPQFLAFLLFAAALLLAGCGGAPEQGEEQVEAIPVEVVHPTGGDLEQSLSFSGTIEPWREASLGAQISGRVEKIFVEVGEEITSGRLLVQMSGEQLTQAEAQFRSAEKDWRRMKSLLDKGTITQQAFEKIDASYEAARAGYELVLESTRIKAPFSGTITAKYLEEGEVFTLMPGTAGSPAILELMQLKPVKVTLQVPERDLPNLRKGMTVKLTTDPFPDRDFIGKVNRIDPTVDSRSRMGSVELLIDNPRRLLKPGMFARVTVVLQKKKGILTLPAECVLTAEGGPYVYVVSDGVARKQPVQIGLGTSELVEVLSGVTAEDTVILVGQRIVRPGQKVGIVNTAEIEGERLR